MTNIDPSCAKTHISLSINPPDALTTENISSRLGIQPTSVWIKGQIRENSISKRPARLNAWILKSKFSVDTNDVNDHIDWLLTTLHGKEEALQTLLAEGCQARIWCYWRSAIGHGGPTLTSRQMARLAVLGLDINFDVYGTI